MAADFPLSAPVLNPTSRRLRSRDQIDREQPGVGIHGQGAAAERLVLVQIQRVLVEVVRHVRRTAVGGVVVAQRGRHPLAGIALRFCGSNRRPREPRAKVARERSTTLIMALARGIAGQAFTLPEITDSDTPVLTFPASSRRQASRCPSIFKRRIESE